MSLLHCDRCGESWSNHENCDDRPDAQSRHLRHIEQLKRELSEALNKCEALAEKLQSAYRTILFLTEALGVTDEADQ